jgi:hypothetical protein
MVNGLAANYQRTISDINLGGITVIGQQHSAMSTSIPTAHLNCFVSSLFLFDHCDRSHSSIVHMLICQTAIRLDLCKTNAGSDHSERQVIGGDWTDYRMGFRESRGDTGHSTVEVQDSHTGILPSRHLGKNARGNGKGLRE